jgi:predicted DNA-binding WGR domain protein
LIKLIKQDEDETIYWEVWQDGRTLMIHYGTVGDTGETEEVKLPMFKRAEKVMDELAEGKVNEGFDYLEEDELIELVVQYSYNEDEMQTAQKLRHSVEDLMNECLGWTGNGSCDGGDIGSGTANIFNYVVDAEKASRTIIEELKNNNLLQGAKIAYLNPEDEEYVVLYPDGAEFDLI